MTRPLSLCGPALLLALTRSASAVGCAAGFQDAGGGVCTATFVSTGAPESVTLPAQVGAITAIVSGAEGGSSLEEQVDPFGGAASPGGKGGRETAVIPVTPGAALTVVVGQAGTGGQLAPPGYGGYGGGGHASSRNGGNGGGGSFIFDVDGPLIAAGGGGGGGYDYNPVVLGHGDQQAPGGNGSGASTAGDGQAVAFCCDGTAPYNAGGGGGASPVAPGSGGHPSLPPSYVFGQADGDPGSGPAVDENNVGNGGNTHNGCCYYTGWAGGGGGGYYGGGGGGNIEAQLEGGGGGGGAGYVTPAAISSSSQTGVQAGDGEVTISYYTGACDVSCSTCSGPAATNCTSCANGLSLVNGACVLSAITSTPTGLPSDTPTETPSTTASPTPTGTPTETATPIPALTTTPTPTATVAPAPTVVLSTAVTQPGGRACLAVTLSGNTGPLSTSNTVGFDAANFTYATAAINPAIGPGSVPNKQLATQSLGVGSQQFDVSGASAVPIPEGLLYTAFFTVGATVVPGAYPLSGTPGGEIIVTTCTGDCNGNNQVSIGEVTKCVNLFLGQPLCNASDPVGNCPVADSNLSGTVSIGEVTQCINRFLGGCP